MKRYLLAILVCSAFAFSAVAVDLNEGLEMYFSFDVSQGTTVPDLSGNGHNGTVYGATHTPDGVRGGAYQFDGINDSIRAGSLGFMPTGTISFWMYADAVESWRNPFSTDYASWDDCIRFEEASDGTFVWGGLGLGTGSGSTYFTHYLKPNLWYHVALTWDGAVSRGYLNGQLACSMNYPPDDAPVHPNIPNNAAYWRERTLTFNNVCLGNGYSTSANRFWKGAVDEVRIYHRALSAADVLQLFENVPPAPAPSLFVTEIGFSPEPDGDQDVTVFLNDETLYLYVKDVNLDSTETRNRVRVLLRQVGRVRGRAQQNVNLDLAPEADGSFRGSVPLSQFQPGFVRVQITGENFGPDYRLFRQADIQILPASTATIQPPVKQANR